MRRDWRSIGGASALVLALAVLLRAWALGEAPLWYDEAMYALLARDVRWELLRAPWILIEPLFVAPLSWWVALGQGAWWLRFPSLVAGVLAVGVAMRIGRCAGGARAAWVVGLLLAVSPAMVYYSRDAKMYAWVMLWVLLAAHFALAVARQPGRWHAHAGYLVAGAALCNTHFAAPLFLGVSGLLVLASLRSLRHAAMWSLTNAAIVLLAVPFILAELRYGATMRPLVFHASPPTPSDLLISFEHLFSAYTRSQPLGMGLLACFTLAVITGVFAGATPRFTRVYLLALGILPPLLLFAVSRVAPWSIYIDRYVIASAGPLLVLAGLGIAGLRVPGLRVGSLAVLLVLSVAALPDVYTRALPDEQPRRKGLIPHLDVAGMATALQAHAKPGDTLTHVFWETEAVLRWHLPQYGSQLAETGDRLRVALNAITHRDFQAFFGWHPLPLRSLLVPGARIWLVLPAGSTSTMHYDRELATVRGVAEQRFGQVFGEGLGRTALYLFEVPTTGATPDRSTTSLVLPGGTVTLSVKDLALALENDTPGPVTVPISAVFGECVLAGSMLRSDLDKDSAWETTPYLANKVLREGTLFRVHPKLPKSDPLTAEAPLAAGRYRVFLERTERGTQYPIPAARIVLTLDGQAFLSQGTFNDRPGGWGWQNLGIVEHDGTAPLRVQLVADDPDRQPEGYAVLGRIVLVRETADTASGPPTTLRDMEIAAGQRVSIALPPHSGERTVSVSGEVAGKAFTLVGP